MEIDVIAVTNSDYWNGINYCIMNDAARVNDDCTPITTFVTMV